MATTHGVDDILSVATVAIVDLEESNREAVGDLPANEPPVVVALGDGNNNTDGNKLKLVEQSDAYLSRLVANNTPGFIEGGESSNSYLLGLMASNKPSLEGREVVSLEVVSLSDSDIFDDETTPSTRNHVPARDGLRPLPGTSGRSMENDDGADPPDEAAEPPPPRRSYHNWNVRIVRICLRIRPSSWNTSRIARNRVRLQRKPSTAAPSNKLGKEFKPGSGLPEPQVPRSTNSFANTATNTVWLPYLVLTMRDWNASAKDLLQ